MTTAAPPPWPAAEPLLSAQAFGTGASLDQDRDQPAAGMPASSDDPASIRRLGQQQARAGSRWLMAIGMALVLTLGATVWGQYRQFSLLDDHVRYESDNLVWSFYQLESEYLQLRELLVEAKHIPGSVEPGPLRLRYELFASRLQLVDPERSQAVVGLQGDHRETLEQLVRILIQHDATFAEQAQGPISVADIDALLASLKPMFLPIHDLSLQATRVVADLIGNRNDAVRDQNRLAMALALFQSLALVAFAGVAVRQFTVLRGQRREQEQLADHLEAMRTRAVHASQAKSVFLANMSHELRTPFHGMLGMLSLLDAQQLGPRQAECLRSARDSATHLLQLLDDILDFSKLESGRVDILPEPTDLNRLMDDVEAIGAPPARAKALLFDSFVDPRLPTWVMSDGKRLRQILFNLVSNAVKFTEQGEVRLRLVLDEPANGRPVAPGEVALRFEVRDTGIGITDELRRQLFQRFTQGDASTARRHGGAGLGLEISRGLAQRMGGDIRVESAPQRGSIFSVHLRLAQCDAPAEAAANQPIDWPAASAAALDVLVVDDHPVNRRYMAMLLERMGHRVRLAVDGTQAIEAVSAQAPDLVLMDLHMPGQDGFDAAKAIRALPGRTGRVPIVALTADAYSETRDRVKAAGMDRFLAKPVLPDEIIALLADRQLIERASGPDAPPSARPGDPQQPTDTMASTDPPPAARRRFRSSDVANQLDMAVIGDVCVGVSLAGLRSVLRSFFDDDSGNQALLLGDLEAGRTERLPTLAHALKGAAASIGLRALAATLRGIETEGTGFDAHTCSASAGQLREQLLDARGLLERMGFL